MPQMLFQSSCAIRMRDSAENTFGRLADHLHVPDDRVLQFLRRHEYRFAGPDEAGDSAATFEYVVQV